MKAVTARQMRQTVSVRGLLSGVHILGFADQAVVSAASFLATVMIGRFTRPSELGVYAMGLSLLMSCLSIQEALITTPYTTQRHTRSGGDAQAGVSLAQSGLLSLITSAVMGVIAGVLSHQRTASQLTPVFFVLAVAAPFLLLREFARRFAFAHLRLGEALAQDSSLAAIQIGGLFLLGCTGDMSAVSATAILGIACAIVVITWLVYSRRNFALCTRNFFAITKRNWRLGKWLFATQLVVSLQALLVYWLLAWLNGTRAAGIYTACMSIALFSNPIILGTANVLTPKCALAWEQGGGPQLRRECIAETAQLGAIIGLFCAVVVPFGAGIMQILYPAKDYAAQGHTVAVLALSMWVMAIGVPGTIALTCMERPRIIFWAAFWATVVTVGLIGWMAPVWGLVGTAYAVLTGNVLRSGMRWFAFLTLVERSEVQVDRDLPCVEAVVARLCPVIDFGDLKIELIASGLEAYIYTVCWHDQAPLNWRVPGAIVVKLYRHNASPDIASVRQQFDSLIRVRAALNGTTLDGWTVLVPMPHYLCETPLALVTSLVTGRPLSHLLEQRTLPRDVAELLPRVIVAAMSRLWSRGQLHGDLTFDNILCDIDSRTLAFVDPGLRRLCPLNKPLSDRWHPSSHDLAHLLYDVEVALLSNIADPTAFQCKRKFAAKLACEVLRTVHGVKEKRRRLQELADCTRLHLTGLPQHTQSWPGVYRVIQRELGLWRLQKLVRTIERGLNQMQNDTYSSC
jgi:O-antigen/teichoic acid export membrane protein/tRNA A-37 threonylcarbamoyl transferase component Bud32